MKKRVAPSKEACFFAFLGIPITTFLCKYGLLALLIFKIKELKKVKCLYSFFGNKNKNTKWTKFIGIDIKSQNKKEVVEEIAKKVFQAFKNADKEIQFTVCFNVAPHPKTETAKQKIAEAKKHCLDWLEYYSKYNPSSDEVIYCKQVLNLLEITSKDNGYAWKK